MFYHKSDRTKYKNIYYECKTMLFRSYLKLFNQIIYIYLYILYKCKHEIFIQSAPSAMKSGDYKLPYHERCILILPLMTALETTFRIGLLCTAY